MKGKMIVRIEITLMDNGSLSVTGFPMHLDTAMRIMGQAMAAVAKHFIQGAKDGKLDADNNFDSNVLIPLRKN